MGKVLVADVFKVAQHNEQRITAVEKDLIDVRRSTIENAADIADIKCTSKEYRDIVEKRIKATEDFTIIAGVTFKLVNWVVGILGTVITALIISLITGKASIIFR